MSSGSGVTLLALHNPVELAHRLAMLDHLSRGRFQWGIGGGGTPSDLALFGLDASDQATVRARSAEVLDVVLPTPRVLRSSETVTSDMRFLSKDSEG